MLGGKCMFNKSIKSILFVVLYILSANVFSMSWLSQKDAAWQCQLPTCDYFLTNKRIYQIQPFNYSTFMIYSLSEEYDFELSLVVDPVHLSDVYRPYFDPTVILITDSRKEHFNPVTIDLLSKSDTTVVIPKSMRGYAEQLLENNKGTVHYIASGEVLKLAKINITAIAYKDQVRDAESAQSAIEGNSYLLELDDKKIYVSGDVSEIKQVEHLRDVDIDIAFVSIKQYPEVDIMQAVNNILANLPLRYIKPGELITYKPQIVYPYSFKTDNNTPDDWAIVMDRIITESNPNISLRVLDWEQSENVLQSGKVAQSK